MRKQEFEAYRTYLALKRHFSPDDFNYFKYYGKIKCTPEGLEARPDRHFFTQLSKFKDVEGIILSNFLSTGRGELWIGDIIDSMEDGEIYTEWKARKESTTYNFKTDIRRFENIGRAMQVIDGQHPELLVSLLGHETSQETAVILDNMFGLFKYWDSEIKDRVIWPTFYRITHAYKPFVEYNEDKCHATFTESM